MTLFEYTRTNKKYAFEDSLCDVLSHFCVHEQFEFHFPARLLFSLSPKAAKETKLLELTDSEIKCFLAAFNRFRTVGSTVIPFEGPLGEPKINISSDEIFSFLVKLFEMNSNNCLHFMQACPLEILTDLFLSETSNMHEETVGLVLGCINNSKQYKAQLMEMFDPFLQIADIKDEDSLCTWIDGMWILIILKCIMCIDVILAWTLNC